MEVTATVAISDSDSASASNSDALGVRVWNGLYCRPFFLANLHLLLQCLGSLCIQCKSLTGVLSTRIPKYCTTKACDKVTSQYFYS